MNDMQRLIREVQQRLLTRQEHFICIGVEHVLQSKLYLKPAADKLCKDIEEVLPGSLGSALITYVSRKKKFPIVNIKPTRKYFRLCAGEVHGKDRALCLEWLDLLYDHYANYAGELNDE